MEFRVEHLSSRGNLVLSGGGAGIERKTKLYLNGKAVAEVFDTIGRVEKPLYLAKPLVREAGKLQGKTLTDSKQGVF
ncbi:MAG: hypothetical protein ACP5O3_02175 [Candidatus Micrarchaeia archaeon]